MSSFCQKVTFVLDNLATAESGAWPSPLPLTPGLFSDTDPELWLSVILNDLRLISSVRKKFTELRLAGRIACVLHDKGMSETD